MNKKKTNKTNKTNRINKMNMCFLAILVILLLLLFQSCSTDIKEEPTAQDKPPAQDKFSTNDKLPVQKLITQDKINNISYLMDVIELDKDYSEFTQIVPEFDPLIKDVANFSDNDYELLKQIWEENMLVLVPFFDNLTLTDSTFLVELSN